MVPSGRNRGLAIAGDEGVSIKMIFKYCAWADEGKEGEKGTAVKDGDPSSVEKDQNFNEKPGSSRRKESKIADAVLRYCPCAFRCRKPVDVVRDDEDSVSTIVTTANTTPVIPLTLNSASDLM